MTGAISEALKDFQQDFKAMISSEKHLISRIIVPGKIGTSVFIEFSLEKLADELTDHAKVPRPCPLLLILIGHKLVKTSLTISKSSDYRSG
jgi:hypothetical protein